MISAFGVAAMVLGAGLAGAPGTQPAGPADGRIVPVSAAQETAGSREALTGLLALVPDTAAARAGLPILAYADLEATVRAGYAEAAPGTGLASLSAEDAMLALARLSAGPQRYLQYFGVMAEEMPGAIGVGVGDVQRGLEFGAQPSWGMVLGLAPDADREAAVAGALAARDFAARDIAGVTVWHRGEDGSMDLADRALADPFGGDLGLASRLFLADGRLAGSPVWPLAEAMAAAAAGTVPTLADDPAIATAVHAATDPGLDGELLQFILLDGTDAMPVPDELLRILEDNIVDPDFGMRLRPEGPLPPYAVAALADRFAGDRDEALVVLVYPDAVSAGQAAAVLADRLTAYAMISAPPAWLDRLMELDAVIAPRVLTDAETGLAAAIVRINYRAVFPTQEARDDGTQPIGGSLFRFLVGALWRGELTPLMVFE